MADVRTTPPSLADPAAVAAELQGFIADAVTDAGMDGVVINLSGGIDSTTTATLAVEALGPESVLGLVLPTETNRSKNMSDAVRMADDLGIEHRVIELQDLLDTFTKVVSSVTRDVRPDPLADGSATMTVPVGHREGYTAAVGNAAARMRMMVAYFEANTTDRLVVGTGNRTELLLGYFTKYGDGAADMLPLAELYKTEVRELARAIDVPTDIIEKPPTAGLWADQTDEDELGAPYERIDTILWNLVVGEAAPVSIADAIDTDLGEVERFAGMIEETAHKRTPPREPAEVSYARD